MMGMHYRFELARRLLQARWEVESSGILRVHRDFSTPGRPRGLSPSRC